MCCKHNDRGTFRHLRSEVPRGASLRNSFRFRLRSISSFGDSLGSGDSSQTQMRSKWLSTLASFCIMIASGGSLNTFSVFSQHMRLLLGYDQQQINLLSFFKELGTSLGILSGFLYNFTGARSVLALGAVLNLAGYLFTYLCLVQVVPDFHIWQLCLAMALVGASAAFTITAVLVPCARNFSRNQGTILSLLDSTNGLAIAVFTLGYQALFTEKHSDAFVLMLGWFPSAGMLLLLPLVKEIPTTTDENNDTSTSKEKDSKDLHNMHLLLVISVVLGVYLMVVSLLFDHIHSGTLFYLLFAIMVVLLFLPSPLILFRTKVAERVTVPGIEEALIQHDEIVHTGEILARDQPPNFSFMQALCSFDMWLIAFATTCGVGGALTVSNNLGQIGIAMGYTSSQSNIFVAVLGLCDFLGGVITGAVSDKVLVRHGVPRPLFFCIMLIILTAANLFMAFGVPGALFIGSILVGISLGGQWAVLFTIMGEIFGLANYATLQNIPAIAKGLGMYFLSVELAGVLYDRQADPDGLCEGVKCYRGTFLVMAGLCALACVMTLVLVFRTKKLYASIQRNQQ